MNEVKEVSKTYFIRGFGPEVEYYTFIYPNKKEVKFPDPDICNIKFTKHIASGEVWRSL